jgi:hypothetical protein
LNHEFQSYILYPFETDPLGYPQTRDIKVHFNRDTLVRLFSARLLRWTGTGAGPAHAIGVTKLIAVTEQTIITVNVYTALGSDHTLITCFIAILPGEAGITQAQTPVDRITYFLTGAEQPVIRTIVIIERAHADIIHLVTGINGTRYPVATVDRRTGLAVTCAITGFLSIAVLIVTTGASP